MPLSRLFARPRLETAVKAVYEAIVAAARHPRFYAVYGVADTVDGRFDMIGLHAVLVLERLSGEGERGLAFSQSLSDYLFADMDRSLREMGVGDLSVGKKVRVMAEVFYGRAQAYRAAFEANDRAVLVAALARNVFPGESRPPGAERLADYALSARGHLLETALASILAGRLDFEKPPA